MPEDYNPNSIDSALTRIETSLNEHRSNFNAHTASTETYRRNLDAKLQAQGSRISALEGDKKKLLGIAIGSGIGAGGLGSAIAKFFGSGGVGQ